MTTVLVTKTFRFRSGAPAAGMPVQVTHRDQSIVLQTLKASPTGTVSLHLAPGSYDFLVMGFRVPLEVIEDEVQGDPALVQHVLSTTPHPAYDDIPSLVLLFENGLI